MKCPICNKNLYGISPCSEEEWKCETDGCPIGYNTLYELYGSTQREITAFIKKDTPEYYVNRFKIRKSLEDE